jgi:hypothetical protein
MKILQLNLYAGSVWYEYIHKFIYSSYNEGHCFKYHKIEDIQTNIKQQIYPIRMHILRKINSFIYFPY